MDEVIFGSNFNYDNEEKVDFAEVGSKKEFMSFWLIIFVPMEGQF